MSPKQPRLGSQALGEPAQPTHIVQVSPSTCHDLSLFKEILGEYRRLDDTIIMRLNRANAVMRDKDRSQGGTAGDVQDQACLKTWRELAANWRHRTKLIEYCVFVVDQSAAEKRTATEDDQSSMLKFKAATLEDEVKRTHVRNELTIESIVRRRSAAAFRSRCQFFVPPSSEVDSTKIWNSI